MCSLVFALDKGRVKFFSLLIGFLYFSEEVACKDEGVELLVGAAHDIFFCTLPLLVSLVDVDDVFADAHNGIHVVGVDDGSHLVFGSDVMNEVVYDKAGFGV